MSQYTAEASVSLLVPTRNRVRSLDRLLASIERCECPDSLRLEVVVVNNASTDDTQRRLAALAAEARRYPLRIIESSQPGKARALNLACSRAGGEIVMVFDDDVVVEQGCVMAHLEAYRSMAVDAVQGKVLPGTDAAGGSVDSSEWWEYNIPYLDHGDEPRMLKGLIGTNMSVKRSVFDRIGGFDVRLGPGSAGFSEDSEFSRRLRRAGFQIGYAPKAIVLHELDPARKGRVYRRQIQYRKGLSRSIYRNDLSLTKTVANLCSNLLHLLWYRLLRRPDKFVKAEGRIMKHWGYLVGRLFPARDD